MPIIKKPFTLAPLNDNPVNIAGVDATGFNKITGGFSHKNGFPTIKFSVPPQPAMLETGTLRLVGQFLVKDGSDNMLKTDAVSVDGGNIPLGFSDGKSTTNAGAINNQNAPNAGGMNNETNVNLPNWGGIKNVIEKVVVQSKKTLVEISSVNNYSQYTSLQECYTNNEVDYKMSPYSRALTTGKNAGNTNRRVVGSCAFDSKAGTAAGGIGDKDTNSLGGMASLSSANDKHIGHYFSISLNVDLLNVDMLNLDDNFLGGLLITLHLNPDSAVFHSRYRGVNGAALVPSAINNFSYTLKNLRLEGRYVIPTEQEMRSYPPALMLGSRLNLINDVHSSINSNSYTPQLQMVKSMVNLFLDNDQTNNFNKNSNNFRKPVGEKSNISAKNGLKFPVNYEVKNVPNFDKPINEQTGAEVSVSSLEKKSISSEILSVVTVSL